MGTYKFIYRKPSNYTQIKYDSYGYADGSETSNTIGWSEKEITFEAENYENALKIVQEYIEKNILISEGKEIKSESLKLFKVVKEWKYSPKCVCVYD